ncbi:carboxypeptidase regulatory-like domain-containing protein [Nakamurella lactea]|uniref:carboxypeptidase regulatory-like domain-containing protein n=1 Tax=Nakamurella lactea TaxID=459515 RepID=UPI00041EFE8C|nr:carboxypeptidase regulatory-like domain-containing protein [Nakamurella lactea]
MRRIVLLITAVLGLGLVVAPAAAASPTTAFAAAALSALSPSATAPAASTPSAPDTAPAEAGADVPTGCNRPDLPSGYARCFSEVHTSATGRLAPNAVGPPASALSPADIRAAYNLPDGGDGRTVAVVAAGGYAAAEADLAVFRAQYGLPVCSTENGCFRKLDQRGGTDYPADDAGWALESALDLDAVSAACPSCHLLLVQADDALIKNLGVAAETAVTVGAKYVSNSYGVPGESAGQVQFDQYYDHPGVVVTAASGDDGHVVNWPASNPNVVAVGGTRLTRDASTARGWAESAWAEGGSGCSLYEAHPSYQDGINTGCPNGRAIADIAAVGDPATGLAVYTSLAQRGETGWFQVGGTSLASPLMAGMYALAGTPAEDTYPVSYPYAAGSADLNDVTDGSNDDCGNILCQAGIGWDGPTGLGTPSGVDALTFGPAGTMTGAVTDATSGAPIGDAVVVAVDPAQGRTYRVRAGADGRFTASLRAGTYNITASGFGYLDATTTGIVIAESQVTTTPLALQPAATRSVSGAVTDGAGHDWPLAATITIDGYPNGVIATDPYTGHYRVELPENGDYTLHVAADYPGYLARTVPVSVGTRDVRADAALEIEQTGCTAPGYANPLRTDFEGWTAAIPQGGWAVSGSTPGWQFDSPGSLRNYTGGDGNFATATPRQNGGTPEDTTLTSPAIDLRGQQSPTLEFQYVFTPKDGTSGAVELSLDGGRTWNLAKTMESGLGKRAVIPVPQATGRSDVRVRFHFAGNGDAYWQLDELTVGACAAVPGGLVAGVLSDANTDRPISGATAAGSTPASDAGYYWAFSAPGRHRLTASAGRYTSATAAVKVTADTVTRRDWRLKAGRLKVGTDTVGVTQELGTTKSKTVKLTNIGGAPLTVSVGEHTADTTPMAAAAQGAPLIEIEGNASAASAALAPQEADRPASGGAAADQSAPAGTSWTAIADYPITILDNAVGYYQGRVYSFGGATPAGYTDAGYRYDPATAAWRAIAPLPQPLANAAGIFLNGVMYVAGGWLYGGIPVKTLYAYHPGTDSWQQLADLPVALSAITVAVDDGQLYTIGGCPDGCSSNVSSVYRYQPATDHWTAVADYPTSISRNACAGIDHELICTGGYDVSGHSTKNTTYAYDPALDSWTRRADLPYAGWGMAFAGANGKLQVAGGTISNVITNRASEYDPVADEWRALPNANHAFFRGGSSCGLYQVGGRIDGAVYGGTASSVLSGYDACGGDEVTWLSTGESEITLAPGSSRSVRISADSSVVPGPATYSAVVSLDTDSPYGSAHIAVTAKVNPPKSWGKLAGTVTDTAGTPIRGATIQVCTMYRPKSGLCGETSYTLRTDQHGNYYQWLSKGYNPLHVTAAASGHLPMFRLTRIRAGATTRADFVLPPS